MPSSRGMGRIIFQGREYASVDEMPPDVRREYAYMLGESAAINHNAIPGASEPGRPFIRAEMVSASELPQLMEVQRRQMAGCRRIAKWIAVGFLALVVLMVASCLFFVQSVFRSSESYELALARARSNRELIAAFGEPITPGWFISGSISSSGATSRANYTVPISGPAGSGRMSVMGTETNGVWDLTVIVSYDRDGRNHVIRMDE